VLSNPTCRDPKPLGKFFCREQLELFSGTFAPQLFPRHSRPSKINHFWRRAVWQTADLQVFYSIF
jgi:hypothetical protein